MSQHSLKNRSYGGVVKNNLIQSGVITADKYFAHVVPSEQINDAFEVAMDFHKSLEVQQIDSKFDSTVSY